MQPTDRTVLLDLWISSQNKIEHQFEIQGVLKIGDEEYEIQIFKQFEDTSKVQPNLEQIISKIQTALKNHFINHPDRPVEDLLNEFDIENLINTEDDIENVFMSRLQQDSIELEDQIRTVFEHMNQENLDLPPTELTINLLNAIENKLEESPLLASRFIDKLQKYYLTNDDAAITTQHLYSNALGSLDHYKVYFGAAENTARPSLSTKILFGIPIETIKTRLAKAVEHNWKPKFFWKFLYNLFSDKDIPFSKYRYVALSIQSISKMKENLTEIKHRLTNNEDGLNFFKKVTGLVYHTELNSTEGRVAAIENYINLFETLYSDATNKNTLTEFFEGAFDEFTVCFEGRFSHLQEYATNKISGMNEVLDYSENSSLEDCISEELRVYREIRYADGSLTQEDVPTVDEFKNYLINERGIFSVKGKNQAGEIVNFTEDSLNELLDYHRDILYVLE